MRAIYPGMPFSPPATLADNIGAADTVIPVSDVSAFPDAPNYATIGTDENGETIKYTAKTATSLSGCVRGVEGAAKAWTAGEPIARNFTAADQADIIAAIGETATAAADAQNTANDAQGAIAPAEDGETASRAIAAGEYFLRGGTLYKATAAISQGAAITPGTNCTATTLAAAVAEINAAKGAAGGFASLDANGLVPANQREIADDADASIKYTLGVNNGLLYIEEV